MKNEPKQIDTPRMACRIPIFAPTRRPGAKENYLAGNAWGQATISGRLGQAHRDLLDCLPAVAMGWRRMETGAVMMRIDPARLRSAMGWQRIRNNYLWSLLEDLADAGVKIKNKENKTILDGHIVDMIARGEAIQRGQRRVGGESVMWLVVIGRPWLELLAHASTRLPLQICKLNYGTSQAVARFMLSHSMAKYKIETVMAAVGIRRKDKAYKQLAADAVALAKMGIVIEGEFVSHNAQ